MRHLLLILGLYFLQIATLQAQSCTLSGSLQDGLVGYWPFCGNANDESGNGNHGITHYSVELSTDRFGNAEGAYYFDGVQSAIEIPHNNIFNTQTLSMAMWVLLDTFQLRNPAGTIISKGKLGFGPQIEPGWGTFIASGDSSITLIDFANSSENCESPLQYYCIAQSNANNSELYDNQWHLITITHSVNGSSIHIDGNFYYSEASTLSMNDSPIVIGAFENGISQSFDEFLTSFKGKIDDVIFWNRELSETEFSALITSQRKPVGRVFLDHNNNCLPSVTGVKNITGTITPGNLEITSDNLGEFHFNYESLSDGVYTVALSEDASFTFTCSNEQTFIITGGVLTGVFNIGVAPISQSCPVFEGALIDSLKAYWPFCATALDATGNNNNGEVFNALSTKDRFGNEHHAFLFNGVNSKIICDGVDLPLGNSARTISIWFKSISEVGAAYSHQGQGYLMGSTNVSTNQIISEEYDITAEDYAVEWDGLDFSFYGLGGVGSMQCSAGTPGSDNQWHHIVGVYCGLDSLKAYFDGIEYFTNICHDEVYFDGFSLNTPLQDITIGGLTEYNGGYQFFEGFIDDVAIWNRALTQEEVTQLYGNYAPIQGCTDTLASNYFPQATANFGCLYTGTISVFNDLNNNGQQDAGEPGLPNRQIISLESGITYWTNTSGIASVIQTSVSGQFALVNNTINWVSTNDSIGTIDFASNLVSIEFGMGVLPGPAAVNALPHNPWDILHCTDGYESSVYLENIGSQTVSGFMTLSCDPLFTPDADSYFTTPPVETGPGYALWNLEDFMPGEFELLTFHIDGPGVEYLNQSFTFDFDLTLFDPQGNVIYNDNWSASPVVSCAYDPNDITGFPEGLSSPHEEGYTIEHYILPDNMVEFRVRFQNTGTLPAEDIDIYIPIDPNKWELNTIYPLMRSAEMQVICLHDDGSIDYTDLEHELPAGVAAEDLLIFSFDDIYLPDSASNPEGSQGYVYFRMGAKHTLNVGDEINAQAFIYFEQNPPIATNETYHVIFDCTSFTPMTGDTELCAGDDLLFSASQPNVDAYAWNIGSLEGSSNIFVFEGIDAGEYTLELNTSNMLCPQGEDHQVTVIVHDIPQLDVPLNATVCEGESITFDADSDGDVSWSNGANTDDIIEATESFTVTATAVGAGGCSVSEDWSVTVNPLPNAAVDIAGNVLTAQDGTSWQWTVNGVDAATTQSITASISGNYQVEITNEFGCAATSELFVISDVSLVQSWSTLNLYPNPMTTTTRLELPQGTFVVALYDITGACVRMMPQQQGAVLIERELLTSGVYQVRIVQGEQSTSLRLVVE